MAKKLAYDRVLFIAVIVLVGLGLTMVYSASAVFARDLGNPVNLFLVKQGLAAFVGVVALWVAMHVDYRHFRRPWVIYSLVGGVLVLLVVVLFGPELNNTRRWLFLGGLSIQPAELAKLAVIGFVAYQIERKQREVDNPRDLVVACALLLGSVGALILLQPDLGTALLICAVALVMLFLAGVRWSYFVAGCMAFLPALWVLVYSVPYRRKRLLVFLDPDLDPLNAGYQARQSLIAVGSGGLFGLGLGDSVQKLYFLPHPHSDFIFSIVAEELGLLGALGVLALFGVLLWRGIAAGARAPDLFGRYLAWGLTGILVMQALVHVSVAVALLPTKGIPLPFVSYGGSSLVVSMTASGVLLNVSQHG
jgi:cell division protein FtsW